MVTAFSKFRLRPGLSPAQAAEEIKETIDVYRGREGLVRKYICLDFAQQRGVGVYLWETREQAEAFFEMAKPIIEKQTGAPPEIEIMDTHVIVDNLAGTSDFYPPES